MNQSMLEAWHEAWDRAISDDYSNADTALLVADFAALRAPGAVISSEPGHVPYFLNLYGRGVAG